MLTRNLAFNRARQNRHIRSETTLPDTIPTRQNDPENILLQHEQTAELKCFIAQLTRSEQVLFYRKFYYLQSTTQIAAELGCTERAAEGRIYRLRKKLQAHLGGEYRA